MDSEAKQRTDNERMNLPTRKRKLIEHAQKEHSSSHEVTTALKKMRYILVSSCLKANLLQLCEPYPARLTDQSQRYGTKKDFLFLACAKMTEMCTNWSHEIFVSVFQLQIDLH